MSESYKLESYLRKRYGLVQLTPGIKSRLEDAYNGDLQVDPERLLSCWKQMEQHLNKIRLQNDARGNKMSGIKLLGYDLSIVLGKYDNYMRYILAAEKTNEEAKISVEDYRMFEKNMQFRPKNYVHKLKDVSDLIDDVYDRLGEDI